MCGRRKVEKEGPELADWGDMPIEMLQRIAKQIPQGVFVQLHNNGEPLLYPHLFGALRLFKDHYTGMDTNGKLLTDPEISKMIRLYLKTLTISVIADDPEGIEQIGIMSEFLKHDVRPLVIFRMLGMVDEYREAMFKSLQHQHPRVLICNRVLHDPMGSFRYVKVPVIPETGVCYEMLHKLAIDRNGNVFPCVRFDPARKNILGNVKRENINEIWESKQRIKWVHYHLNGQRGMVPLCKTCEYWGIPRG